MGRPISVKALESIDFGFLHGDRVTLKITTIYGPSKAKTRTKNYTVTQETDQCVTLDNGQYKETINKRDVALGVVRTEIIKWERDDEMGLKFTREELLDAARQVGGRVPGCLRKIWELLGDKAMDTKQVSYALSKWNIFEELEKEKAEGKPAETPLLRAKDIDKKIAELKTEDTAKAIVDEIKVQQERPDWCAAVDMKKIIADITPEEKAAVGRTIERINAMPITPPKKVRTGLRVDKVVGDMCTYELGNASEMVLISLNGAEEQIAINFEDLEYFISELVELNEVYIRAPRRDAE